MELFTGFSQLKMSDDEYHLLRNLVYEECGIWFKQEKKEFVKNRTSQRMRALEITSCYRYYKLLTNEETGQKELITYLDALTINETSFFRNKPQMDLFADTLLPEIIAKKRKQGDLSLKIWSAACSTGQEPYTIAMILKSRILDFAKWKITILASDLSLTVLETAQKGLYEEHRLRGLDDDNRRRFFKKTEEGYQINDELKSIVVFDFHNLMHEMSTYKNFDFIFCRNVLIYFDEKTQASVIERFYKGLIPLGYLLLGHAETLQGTNDDFIFIHKNKGTAYRKKE